MENSTTRLAIRFSRPRQNEWGEWESKAYDQFGNRYEESDVFESDKQDCLDTMDAIKEHSCSQVDRHSMIRSIRRTTRRNTKTAILEDLPTVNLLLLVSMLER